MNEFRPSRQAEVARWILRGAMIAAIFFLALQRGFEGPQLLGVTLAVVWALLLPLVLTWTWRWTAGRPPWQRVGATAVMALVLLLAFAAGVRPLLG